MALMRAFAIDKYGETGTVRDLPAPEPSPGQVLIRVTAAGVNPVDWKIRDGYSDPKPLPLILGQDFAGVVERAEAVDEPRAGQRVFGASRSHGSYAEYTLVPAGSHNDPIAPVPEGVSDAQAAALPTAGLTALAALEILGVRDGTTVLIVGATGGVGAFATQLAHQRGAHVIGTVRSGPERARELGADETIAGDDVAAQVKRAHPDGVDAVLDLVHDEDGTKALAEVIKPGGAIVSTIHGADEAWFAQRNIKATNVVVNQTPQWSPAGLSELAGMVAAGKLDVGIALEAPLADAARVLERSKTGSLGGKAILRP